MRPADKERIVEKAKTEIKEILNEFIKTEGLNFALTTGVISAFEKVIKEKSLDQGLLKAFRIVIKHYEDRRIPREQEIYKPKKEKILETIDQILIKSKVFTPEEKEKILVGCSRKIDDVFDYDKTLKRCKEFLKTIDLKIAKNTVKAKTKEPENYNKSTPHHDKGK